MAGMSLKRFSGKEMAPVTSHLGEVLREIRLALGKSLDEVAQAAGITRLALHNLETGKASSRADTYERVARALGTDYEHVVRLAKKRAMGKG